MTPFFISVVIVLVLFVIWVIVALILDRTRKIRRRHADMMRVKAKYNIKRVPIQKTVIYEMKLEDAIQMYSSPTDCNTCFFRNHDFYHEEPCKTCTDPDDDKRRNMYDGTPLPDHSGSFKRW